MRQAGSTAGRLERCVEQRTETGREDVSCGLGERRDGQKSRRGVVWCGHLTWCNLLWWWPELRCVGRRDPGNVRT